MLGRIHSVQTLGTVDGPGVRFVLFLQGCPLRCHFCHNPDTWDVAGGKEMSVEEIIAQITRYRAYFGKDGGLTVSGGEPLLQSDFVCELFTRCRALGIHTALDTSGCIWNESVERLLDVTDLCLLDHKMPTDELYRKHIGCSIDAPLRFLAELNARKIPTWIRRVVVPTVTDEKELTKPLYDLCAQFPCVQKIELLPFRKLCTTKYEQMGIPFPFGDLPAANAAAVQALSVACQERD